MNPMLARLQASSQRALQSRERVKEDRRVSLAKEIRDFARIAVPPTGGRTDPVSPHIDRNDLVRTYKGSTSIAVGVIARTVAMKEAKVQALRKDKTGEKLIDVPPDHPLRELFRHVNPIHTQWDLWFYMVGFRLLTGDSFNWKVRNGLGIPTELWTIPSPWVFPVPSREKYIDHWQVRSMFGRDAKIPTEDMLHMMEPNFDWSGNRRFFGWPRQAQAADMVENENAMLKRLRYHFKNFSPPALQYETEEELDDVGLRNMYATISAQHQMSEHTGRPIISHSGLKLKGDLSKSPREMDYTGSLNHSMDWILAIYGVPKAAAGLVTDINRANWVGAMMGFATRTINPLLVHLGQHLSQSFHGDFDDTLVISFDEMTVDDAEQMRKDIQTAQSSGAVDIDEVRDLLLGLEPYKIGGNRPLIRGGMTLGDFGNIEEGEENPTKANQPDPLKQPGQEQPQPSQEGQPLDADGSTKNTPNPPNDVSSQTRKSYQTIITLDQLLKSMERYYGPSSVGESFPNSRSTATVRNGRNGRSS
jgi:phage portal protein BeeE